MFDVDGTIIDTITSSSLRPLTVELLETLSERRVPAILWSAGGADYARRRADHFEISAHFAAFYSKGPRGADGRRRLDHLDPAHHPGTFVDDMPDELPPTGRVLHVRQYLAANRHDRGLEDALRLARSMGHNEAGRRRNAT